jgi:L-threonylcarbamoyladenylate synthase
MTEIIKINPTAPERGKISTAADYIKRGGIVIFPTETVYGMGANAFDADACAKIFKVKGRPADNPLIITVSSFEMADGIGVIPREYIKTIKKIWPSPITFIVKTKKEFPKEVTAGLETIAIRMPAHPVTLELIARCGTPIVGPSANPSKKPTATNASQAIKYFDGKVDCIIDSGRSFFGVESTIIDLERFSILRPGPFTPEEIEKAFGKKIKIDKVSKGEASAEHLISPGTKYRHYAPDTPFYLFEGSIDSLIEMLDNIEELPDFAFVGSSESCTQMSKELGCSTIDLGPRSNMYEIAKNLYDGIILLDSLKVNFGIAESFDERGIGLAIMNRVRKATSHKQLSDEIGNIINV